MNPSFSICIPTYNGARYLAACLDSVLSQTYKDIEILVVDDGSTDTTLEIVEGYTARDPRIRLVRNERNRGLVGNWNHCIELARGEWIKFVFQDDLIAPTCLERLFATAQEQSAQFVICRREFQFEETTDPQLKRELNESPTLWSIFGDIPYINPQNISRMALQYPGANLVGEPTGVMLHRTVFERFGKFNPAFIQICDWEYWLRVACNIGVACVPESLATFRVHGGATSSGNRESRHFRMILLDQLLLKHELAYNKFFSPIRHFSRQCIPPINLKVDMAEFAYWARNTAKRLSGDHADGNSRELREWDEMVARYPLLENSWYMRLVEIRHWYAKHVKWRLSPKTPRSS